MGIKIVNVPFDVGTGQFDNDYLASETKGLDIKEMKTELIKLGDKTYWSIVIRFSDKQEEKSVKSGKIMYPIDTELTPQETQLYEVLKNWRRGLAEDNNVPSYVISSNRELIQIIKGKPKNMEEIKMLHGWGNKRTSDYGQEILNILRDFEELYVEEEVESINYEEND